MHFQFYNNIWSLSLSNKQFIIYLQYHNLIFYWNLHNESYPVSHEIAHWWIANWLLLNLEIPDFTGLRASRQATKMLVTIGWWWLYVGDGISILVTSSGCWCPTPMLKYRGCWWRKRPKPSPTFQSCRQHISSPTSVTNIDVVPY